MNSGKGSAFPCAMQKLTLQLCVLDDLHEDDLLITVTPSVREFNWTAPEIYRSPGELSLLILRIYVSEISAKEQLPWFTDGTSVLLITDERSHLLQPQAIPL